MFELHDALLYAMSVCSLVSLACLYLAWAPAASLVDWTAVRETRMAPARIRLPRGMTPTRRQRFARLTKRKTVPDDDSSPCAALLN